MGAIDRAGQALVNPEGLDDETLANALVVINNWRSCHGFPVNAIQNMLRARVEANYPGGIVTQRLKRINSMRSKLLRKPDQKLSRVQDIGGCRAIVKNLSMVEELLARCESSRSLHEIRKVDNYIDRPKESGYRGIHVVYSYRSNRNPEHNSRKVEVQLRSRPQHAWATAVETMGMIGRENLKGGQGNADMLRFFALAGSAIALTEGRDTVPDTPASAADLTSELKHYARTLNVVNQLEAARSALKMTETSSPHRTMQYYLLEFSRDDANLSLGVTGYPAGLSSRAYHDYLISERARLAQRGSDVVLVSARSLTELRQAYPNYYADTAVFLGIVRPVIE